MKFNFQINALDYIKHPLKRIGHILFSCIYIYIYIYIYIILVPGMVQQQDYNTRCLAKVATDGHLILP